MTDGGSLVASVFVSDVNPTAVAGARPNIGRYGVFHNGDQKVQVDGIWFPNALAMHPLSNRTDQVHYELKGVCNRFVSLVALNDDVLEEICPVVFRVYCDGDVKWESEPVTQRQEPQTCDVDITGAQVLKLSASCEGESELAHAVWLEPIVQSTLRQVMEATTESGLASTVELSASASQDAPEGDQNALDGEVSGEFLKSFSKSMKKEPNSEISQLSQSFMQSFKAVTPVKAKPAGESEGAEIDERNPEVVALLETFKREKIESPDRPHQSKDVVADLMETINKTNAKLQEEEDHVSDVDTSAIFVANELAKNQVAKTAALARAAAAGKSSPSPAKKSPRKSPRASPAIVKAKREQTPSPSTAKATGSPKLVITEIHSADLEPVSDPGPVLARAHAKEKEAHWEDQFHSITAYRRLVKHCSAVLTEDEQWDSIVHMLAKQAGNLRSTLARHAIQALGDVCAAYGKDHHQARNTTLAISTLVLKGTTKNKFVVKEIHNSIDIWVDNAGYTDSLAELLKHCAHKNPAVRALACHAIATFTDRAGDRTHLKSKEVFTEILPVFAKFLHERLPAARDAGKVGVRAVRKYAGATEADALFKAHCSDSEYRSVAGVK